MTTKNASSIAHVSSKPTIKKENSSMSAKNASSVAHVSSKPITKNKKRSAMSTKIESSVSNVSAVAPTTEAPVASPVPAPPAVATTGAATSAAASLVFIQPPPKGATIPSVPDDYAPPTPGEFTAVLPRQSELAALPQALIDLGNFTDYATTLGATAPALAEVQQSFSVGAQWSTMRQQSSRWDGFAGMQEGLSWEAMREQMDTLRPAFALAAKRDPKLIVRFAGLAKLLGAKQAIAQKGASTRRANKKAEAEGKPQVHGKVGKKRQRAAEKASLAAAGSATPVAVAQVASAALAAVTPVAGAAVVAPANANGVVNGVGH